jgi:hypothetical protein
MLRRRARTLQADLKATLLCSGSAARIGTRHVPEMITIASIVARSRFIKIVSNRQPQ